MYIQKVIEQEIKSNICNTILRALPDWFGDCLLYTSDAADE